MADDDLSRYRKTPPETPEEWQEHNRSVQRVNKAWPILSPIVAFVESRKAWVALVGAWAYFEGYVSAFLKMLMEGPK